MNLKKAIGMICIVSFLSTGMISCSSGSSVSQKEYSQPKKKSFAGKLIKKAGLKAISVGIL